MSDPKITNVDMEAAFTLLSFKAHDPRVSELHLKLPRVEAEDRELEAELRQKFTGLEAELRQKFARQGTIPCARGGPGPVTSSEAPVAATISFCDQEPHPLHGVEETQSHLSPPIASAKSHPKWVQAVAHYIRQDFRAWSGSADTKMKLILRQWSPADSRGKDSKIRMIREHLCRLQGQTFMIIAVNLNLPQDLRINFTEEETQDIIKDVRQYSLGLDDKEFADLCPLFEHYVNRGDTQNEDESQSRSTRLIQLLQKINQPRHGLTWDVKIKAALHNFLVRQYDKFKTGGGLDSDWRFKTTVTMGSALERVNKYPHLVRKMQRQGYVTLDAQYTTNCNEWVLEYAPPSPGSQIHSGTKLYAFFENYFLSLSPEVIQRQYVFTLPNTMCEELTQVAGDYEFRENSFFVIQDKVNTKKIYYFCIRTTIKNENPKPQMELNQECFQRWRTRTVQELKKESTDAIHNHIDLIFFQWILVFVQLERAKIKKREREMSVHSQPFSDRVHAVQSSSSRYQYGGSSASSSKGHNNTQHADEKRKRHDHEPRLDVRPVKRAKNSANSAVSPVSEAKSIIVID